MNRFRLSSLSQFSRNVILLAGATLVAQIIPVAVSPLITRLFSSEEFGFFAVFASVVSFLVVFSTARYEMAIIVPASERESASLTLLSSLLCLGVSFIVFLFTFFYSESLSEITGVEIPESQWKMLPLALLFTGVYQSINYWENKKGNYKALSANRVIRSVVTAAVTLLLGYLAYTSLGLVVGYISGMLAGLILLSISFLKTDYLRSTRSSDLINTARKYSSFPLYLLPGHALNAASSAIPLFFLGSYFNAAEAGYFALVHRVIASPMLIVTSSFADVFRERASKDYNEFDSCRPLYVKTMKKLFLLAIVPVITLLFFGEQLFPIIFGDEWIKAGTYSKYLAIMFLFQFLANPLSTTVIISEKQKIDLLWQVVLFIMVLLSIAGGYYFKSAEVAVILYSIVYTIMYICSIFISYHFSVKR